MALALEIGEAKRQLGKGIRDLFRETRVVENLLHHSPQHLEPGEVEEVYSAIFRISRKRQGQQKEYTALICTTVMESDPEQARQKMRAAAKVGDLVELRLDPLKKIDMNTFLPFSQSPLIVTNRKKEEGGFFKGKEGQRFFYLKEAVRLGATYVDVEWKTSDAHLSQLMESKENTRVILSYHDIQGTPPLEELHSLWEQMSDTGADLIKIVPTARNLEDSLTVLRFLWEVKDRGKKVVAHCMGEPGRISRVLSPLFGSSIAYAALRGGGAGAPGQMDACRMQWLWEALGI
jgi:3-dehydroquinate dehydratase type I